MDGVNGGGRLRQNEKYPAFVNKGADLKLRNKDGDDAMALATKAGYKETALLLTTYAATGKAAQDK